MGFFASAFFAARHFAARFFGVDLEGVDGIAPEHVLPTPAWPELAAEGCPALAAHGFALTFAVEAPADLAAAPTPALAATSGEPLLAAAFAGLPALAGSTVLLVRAPRVLAPEAS